MPRLKSDPLIAALIKKLPVPHAGVDWPVDQQLAWLNLMALALGAVYGGDAANRLGGSQPKPTFVPVQPKSKTRPGGTSQFYIDDQGMVRNASGKRVLPKDVISEVFDTRGELGDMKSIVWADDSTGLNGADLTITSA